MGQPVLDIETVALAARGGYEGPPNDFREYARLLDA